MISHTTTSTPLGSGTRIDATVRNDGRRPLPLGSYAINVSADQPAVVLEHGWQSWSVVRRCRPDDVRPERAAQPKWARGCLTADADAAGRNVIGDQFLVHDGGVVGWLDARRHFGTVRCSAEGTDAVALGGDTVLEPGESLVLDPLWVAEGEPGECYAELATHWGAVAGARAATVAPAGWCSWYEYFADVNPDAVRANLRLAAIHGLDLVQIDDGYQAAIGDWLEPWPGWEPGVGALAREIADAGLLAGIWTAPFLMGENSRLFAAHPDWVVRDDARRPRRAMFNAANWGGWTYALDTSRDDVLDWLTSTFAALRAAGFGYHKIDFCYAAALDGQRADQSCGRAAALRRGLDAVRAGIGDDAFLLGCGCPFGPAVGVVDAMRVSADVAPAWDPADHWPGYPESVPAAVNAVKASVLRAPLHRRLWANDPDCLLLRPTATSLDDRQRRALAAVVAGTGGFVLLSDDLARYGDEEWATVEALLAHRADGDTTLAIDGLFAETVGVRPDAGLGSGSRLVADFEDLAGCRLDGPVR